MAHDAVPNWSGYNYQGKVAIYYTLTKINELKVNGGDIENIKNYKLEIEYLEDFAIIDNNNKYLSVHQVKAGDSFDSYSEIKAWFDKSINNVVEMNCSNLSKDTKAFIVAKDEGKVYRTKKAEKLTYADTIVICNKSDVEQSKQFIHTSISEDNSGQKIINCIEYIKLTEILSTQSTYNFVNLKDCFKDYLPYDGSIQRFLHLSKTHQWTDYIYSYDNGSTSPQKYCTFDEIDSFIDKQIETYKDRTASQIKSIRLKLHELLAQHIANRHKNHGNNPERCINFSEILSLLDNQNSINIDSEDDAYLELKYKFIRCLENVKLELENNNQEVNQNLKELNKFVSQLNGEDIKIFVRLISPDQHAENNNVSEIFDRFVQWSLIKNPYLKIINRLQNRELIINSNKVFSYKIHARNYLPSTINDDVEDATSVASSIMRNYKNDPEVYSLLMNVTDIITRHIDLNNIADESIHIHGGLASTEEKFMKIGRIRLINIENARGEINE